MKRVYVYVMDTLADWELGFVTAELNSRRFFRKDAPEVAVMTVGLSKKCIKTMGGLTVTPDGVLEDVVLDKDSMLILPGSNVWNAPEHEAAVRKAGELLACGGAAGAICGATVALAKAGMLDERRHTSNGPGFLEMFAKEYKGQPLYEDTRAVCDGSLITASVTGAVQFAYEIIRYLDVFRADTLEAWNDFFGNGRMESFYALMQTLQEK